MAVSRAIRSHFNKLSANGQFELAVLRQAQHERIDMFGMNGFAGIWSLENGV